MVAVATAASAAYGVRQGAVTMSPGGTGDVCEPKRSRRHEGTADMAKSKKSKKDKKSKKKDKKGKKGKKK